MVTKNKVRKQLSQYMNKIDPNHDQITWEMATFRHAVHDMVTKCLRIEAFRWSVNRETERLNFLVFFKTRSIMCSYDYKTQLVDVEVTEDDKGFQFKETITCDRFSDVMTQLQPKIKVCIMRK